MKRHGCARRVGVCLVLGCAGITQATRVQAQAWEIVPDITLSAETNDNPSLDAGPGSTTGSGQPIDSASRMLADATVRFRRADPRGDLMFEPRVRGDAYVEDEAQAYESTDVFLRSNGMYRGQTVRVGYAADIGREKILGVEFLETLDPIGEDPSGATTNQVGRNEERTRFGISPYVDIQLNSRGSLRLDGRLVDVDYEQGATAGRTDFLDRELGGEWRRELDQQGTLGVRMFATGYEAALNNNQTDTRGAELSYGREVTELWSWTVSGGTQRSDFAYSSGGRRVVGTDSTPIFGLEFTKRGEVSTMSAELRRTMSPDALGFVAPRDEVRLAWQRLLSARVNGRVVLRGVDAEGVPTIVNSGRRYGRLDTDVEWQFKQTWWFVAGYAFSSARSTTTTDSADSNTLTLGVRYRGRSTQQPQGSLTL